MSTGARGAGNAAGILGGRTRAPAPAWPGDPGHHVLGGDGTGRKDHGVSSRVPLTLACWDYDRTRALATGEIRPEGVDLTYLSLPVEETFFRMARHQEFDVAEMSLASYVVSLARGAPATAIPVFPSRAFRHNGIYVNAASGIGQPADLAGRIIGIPEYQLTAVVWIRGLLAEHYGVPLESAALADRRPGRAGTDREAPGHGAPGGGHPAHPGAPDAQRHAGIRGDRRRVLPADAPAVRRAAAPGTPALR